MDLSTDGRQKTSREISRRKVRILLQKKSAPRIFGSVAPLKHFKVIRRDTS